MKTVPPYPKCGKTPEKVSERAVDNRDGFLAIKAGAPDFLICIYRCSCGTTFSQTEKREDKAAS